MVAPTPSTSSEMTASGGLWSVCENIIRESEEDDPLSTLSSNNSLKEEVEKYLRSPNIPRDADPLLFWHNDVLYPHLKKLAQKYFSFQMSSVASERLFSTAERHAETTDFHMVRSLHISLDSLTPINLLCKFVAYGWRNESCMNKSENVQNAIHVLVKFWGAPSISYEFIIRYQL
ncbi:hypothetical protein EVAR_81550_1 [Eumeta japonica]|uniref:HAT C-terminal dimerisation domain-containing protein n=1 Tax=Eumeta variegata TaxID=151549 RepID=A0A4C1V147_EUMVA|nr:hypothetical protein EVAR_81550_1 [Eumeta japonica]